MVIKIVYTVLLIPAIALTLFCVWGFTLGASQFDEMAGMALFLAALLAGILYFLCAVIWLVRKYLLKK
ncbi:MAG: hypothetical protein OEY56_09080 [Cyclobacteriaceae bacterium]|nr:hypothetical protein [Cyclobacteriaceae bacterium]